ncbi:MAG: CPBP family intramembrane metalloprotease [Puniceicoccales bacterium]|jgi:membrane protease YdiL (CAAX protease family)|nr:CPBP family intramembrane metalloprotease [Puniceicoccales bacterium]
MEKKGVLKHAPPGYALGIILCFYLISIGFAAAIAPAAQRLLLKLHANFPCNLSAYLVGKPVVKIFDRLNLLIFTAGIIPFSCTFRLFQRKAIGLHFWEWRCWLRYFFLGMGLSIGSILPPLFFTPWALKMCSLNEVLFRTFACAVVVSFLEEIIFRSCILGVLRTAMQSAMAITFSSLFFAIVHFRPTAASVGILSMPLSWKESFTIGYRCATEIFHSFHPIAFFNLFILGCIFAIIRIRKGHLMASIGLHGGIVWMLLLFRKLIYWDGKCFFWNPAGPIDAPFATIILLLLLIYFHGQLANKNIGA